MVANRTALCERVDGLSISSGTSDPARAAERFCFGRAGQRVYVNNGSPFVDYCGAIPDSRGRWHGLPVFVAVAHEYTSNVYSLTLGKARWGQPPRTIEEAEALTAKVTAGLLRGEIEPKVASVASKLCRDFIKAHKDGHLEREIEALKHQHPG